MHKRLNYITTNNPIAIAFLMCAFLLTASCAKRPPANDIDATFAYEEANDPFEPLNRKTFAVNMFFDETVVEPTARLYRMWGPPDLRDGISNFVTNWREPVTFVNDVLQAEPKRAQNSFSRFLINSTFGLLGLFDTASKWGIEGHNEDFGETFAVWGLPEGPFIVLPLLGPSNARDLSGFVVDFFYDPVSLWLAHENWTYVRYGRLAMRGLIYREENLETLDDLSKSSTDFYATIRSSYRQLRQYDINNGNLDTSNEDDLFDEDFDDDF
ncbi:MAG: VacJ family lipoprotein [Emcibacteraceae bacterium]|nr:VacJ family lipoprotein [Emcibacteraceae bacterium]MDG1859240.1 VacJ family lipoprotein [Emcibacteraceae bacterium]